MMLVNLHRRRGEKMKIKLLAVGFIVWLTAAIAAQDVATDMKALQGPWIAMDAELAGQKLPETTKSTFRLEIKGDKYSVVSGNVNDQGIIKLDPTKSPKTMDIIGTEG